MGEAADVSAEWLAKLRKRAEGYVERHYSQMNIPAATVLALLDEVDRLRLKAEMQRLEDPRA